MQHITYLHTVLAIKAYLTLDFLFGYILAEFFYENGMVSKLCQKEVSILTLQLMSRVGSGIRLYNDYVIFRS